MVSVSDMILSVIYCTFLGTPGLGPSPSLHSLCLNVRPVMKTMRLYVMTHHLREAHIWDRGDIMRPGDSLSLVLIWPLLQFWREILCRVFVLPPEWTPC